MPSRPANIPGTDQAAHVVNQSVRELHARIDDLAKKVSPHSVLKSSSKLSFGAIGANSTVERTFILQGASAQGTAHVSPQLTLGNTNLIWSAYVSKQNQVTVRLLNPTGAPVTPNTVTWSVSVIQ